MSRTLTSGALFGWAVGCSLVAFAVSVPAVLPLLESDISTAMQATGAAQGAGLAARVVAFSIAASTATSPVITALVILLAGLMAGRPLAWRHAFRAAVVGTLPMAVVKPVANLVQGALLPPSMTTHMTDLSLGPARWLAVPSLPPGQTILLHTAELPALWGALLVGLCLMGVPGMPKRDAWLMAAYAWAIGVAINLVPALL